MITPWTEQRKIKVSFKIAQNHLYQYTALSESVLGNRDGILFHYGEPGNGMRESRMIHPIPGATFRDVFHDIMSAQYDGRKYLRTCYTYIRTGEFTFDLVALTSGIIFQNSTYGGYRSPNNAETRTMNVALWAKQLIDIREAELGRKNREYWFNLRRDASIKLASQGVPQVRSLDLRHRDESPWT